LDTVLESSLVELPPPGDVPSSHVTEQSATLFSLRLWGRLHPNWAGNLSLGLSQTGFSIMGGFARRNLAGRWVAELLVRPTDSAPPPGMIDFLALSQVSRPEIHPGPVELTASTLDDSPDHGANMLLEVRGPDRIGFLASFLRTLSEAGVFPTQMALGTRDGQVFDRFLIRSAKTDVPRGEVRRALAQRLDQMTGPRAC